MAKSHFEYVKIFELSDAILPKCWPVVRIDGKGFHRFSDMHGFEKPNDQRSLGLMSKAAVRVMEDFQDVMISYGHSDEYSFVFSKNTSLFNRRQSKITSTVVSLFSSCFVFHWPEYFPDTKLQYPPSFDARIVAYPTRRILRDYLSWRQADCHINNLYNTVFWALVQQSLLKPREAQEKLKGTNSGDKNEILFSQFGVNYNNLPELFRKGTILTRSPPEAEPTALAIVSQNCDLIREDFWVANPHILGEEQE